jgi:hypothetical protein
MKFIRNLMKKVNFKLKSFKLEHLSYSSHLKEGKKFYTKTSLINEALNI